jgi:hypothetical protein
MIVFPKNVGVKENRKTLLCKRSGGDSNSPFPRDARTSWSYAISVAVSAKRMKGRWVVYERRDGEFIFLSRLFATRAQAEKERDKLKTSFKSRRVSLGVGFVVKR